jgi:hypothetical protein
MRRRRRTHIGGPRMERGKIIIRLFKYAAVVADRVFFL